MAPLLRHMLAFIRDTATARAAANQPPAPEPKVNRSTGDYLRLFAVAEQRHLNVGLQATLAEGMYRLTVTTAKHTEVSWAPCMVGDWDVAAHVVLDELGAEKEQSS